MTPLLRKGKAAGHTENEFSPAWLSLRLCPSCPLRCSYPCSSLRAHLSALPSGDGIATEIERGSSHGLWLWSALSWRDVTLQQGFCLLKTGNLLIDALDNRYRVHGKHYSQSVPTALLAATVPQKFSTSGTTGSSAYNYNLPVLYPSTIADFAKNNMLFSGGDSHKESRHCYSWFLPVARSK